MGEPRGHEVSYFIGGDRGALGVAENDDLVSQG